MLTDQTNSSFCSERNLFCVIFESKHLLLMSPPPTAHRHVQKTSRQAPKREWFWTQTVAHLMLPDSILL